MKYIKFLSLLTLALLLAGCGMLPDSETGTFENGQKISKVQVNIGGNARTILPNVWGYSKFILSAEPDAGNSNPAPSPVITEADEWGNINFSPEISLPFGKWIISVTTFVDVDGIDYPAASGSTLFTVESFYHSIEIPVYFPVPGGVGEFAYTVIYPTGAAVSVKLDTWPIGGSPVYFNDFFDSDSQVIADNLDSGMYFLTVTGSRDGKTVTRNEIVHIYQQAASTAYYNLIFDLSDLITVSGNAYITKNGDGVNQAYVEVWRADDDGWLANTEVELWNNGYWEIKLPVFDSPTDVYFTVNFEDYKWNWSNGISTGVTQNLFDSDVSDVDLNVNVSTIYLSGYADIFVNGEYPDWVDIEVYKADGDERLASTDGVNWSNCSWEVEIPSFDAPTALYFVIYGNDFEYNSFNKRIDNNHLGSIITAHNDNVRDIILLDESILLSGNVTVTVDGSFEYLSYYDHVFDVGSTPGGWDFGGAWFDVNTGEWIKIIPESYLNKTIYLTLFVGAYGCQLHVEGSEIYLGSKEISNFNFEVDLMWE